MELTEQQRAAVEFPGNVAISAGAGSGKTRVLVEKYLRELGELHPDWPVSSVVLITFTVKAASELRGRIVRRIGELLQANDITRERRARLEEIRNSITAAPIGTIHNYCSRILREFALEAGVDPAFAIIETVHEAALKRDAVQRAFEGAAADPATPEYRELLLLSTLYSRVMLTRLVNRMLDNRGDLVETATRFSTSALEELMILVRKFHSDTIATKRSEIVRDYGAGLDSLRSVWGGALIPEPFAGAISTWTALVESRASWSAFRSEMERMRAVLYTQEGTLRKTIEKLLPSQELQWSEVLSQACDSAGGAHVSDLTPADAENVEVTAALARLFLRAEGEYCRARRATGPDTTDQLDFADLEVLAERLLLEKQDVCRVLRERTRLLMIDEFQDTSERQWNILSRLVRDGDGNLIRGRFFMVGDAKQSVYGFRRAGNRIFEMASEAVSDSNADAGGSGLVNMHANFRTCLEPLRAINAIFASVMATGSVEFQVKFEPLELRRNEAAGCVKLLLAQTMDSDGDNPPESGQALQSAQAQMVASRIRDIAATQGRKFGEFALLFRKRKHFADYELALRREGIPFVTYRGRGLYEQPEIVDLMAFLRFALDSSDDAITVQILRGPLLNFTDNLLLAISLLKGGSFWNKVCALEAAGRVMTDASPYVLSESEARRMAFACRLLTTVRDSAGVMLVSDLIRLVLEESGGYAIYASTERGSQALANIGKFVEGARNLGTRNIEEFVEFAERQSLDARGEGEATEEGAGDGVRLMTIHAAKGLEFPVVFLPELDDAFFDRPEELLIGDDGLFALRRARSVDSQSVFLHDYLSKVQKLKSQSEERRVFYVAATRCRDELYFCANRQPDYTNSVMGWIADGSDLVRALARGEDHVTFAGGSEVRVPLEVMPIYFDAPQMPESALLTDEHFLAEEVRLNRQLMEMPNELVTDSWGTALAEQELLEKMLASPTTMQAIRDIMDVSAVDGSELIDGRPLAITFRWDDTICSLKVYGHSADNRCHTVRLRELFDNQDALFAVSALHCYAVSRAYPDLDAASCVGYLTADDAGEMQVVFRDIPGLANVLEGIFRSTQVTSPAYGIAMEPSKS